MSKGFIDIRLDHRTSLVRRAADVLASVGIEHQG
jgi:hypothetical protein